VSGPLAKPLRAPTIEPESALESASRFKLDGRVPTPELQASIFDHLGTFLGRCDLLWDEVGAVGEADGLDKYDDAQRSSLRQEKLRQERFERPDSRWSGGATPT
jgi:hypothetical protein